MQSYPMTLERANYLFMKNESKLVNLDDVKGRIAAEDVLPYLPGAFIVTPGEKWSDIDRKYFEVLIGAVERFLGFASEIQGVHWD